LELLVRFFRFTGQEGGDIAMENRNTRFPEDLVNVRVQANTSYQIKRVIELVQSEKGLELMSCSKIMPNSGSGPRLRQFATFKDLKYEKKQQQRKNKQRNIRRKF
jgi:hypothetical protein